MLTLEHTTEVIRERDTWLYPVWEEFCSQALVLFLTRGFTRGVWCNGYGVGLVT
uniref:Uncharacterized protein n=1 Tax=Anguilla anguilla TaxID=7936 RepID=A0A0E9RZM0_ANGAN